ncbi:MAG: hypothetical protein LBP54_08925 [Campylobacteraceae bacterium]|jgi:hypothetical protein|nr:hypothetical protein [Campylobacteraceae bacterium]
MMMKEQKNDGMISKTKIVLIVSIISTVLFVICMILLVNLIIILHFSGYSKDWIIQAVLFLLFIPFLPFYILHILFSTIFIYLKYKKIIYVNVVSIILLGAFYILYTTGFCFKEMRYFSKAELTDIVTDMYANYNCFEEYKSKHSNVTYTSKLQEIANKECSISFESIKREAPQCFTNKRPNKCKGTITYFDKEMNSLVKKEVYIYEISGRGDRGGFISYEYLRYFISSGLDMRDNRDNSLLIGCCGTVKSVGRWDW